MKVLLGHSAMPVRCLTRAFAGGFGTGCKVRREAFVTPQLSLSNLFSKASQRHHEASRMSYWCVQQCSCNACAMPDEEVVAGGGGGVSFAALPDPAASCPSPQPHSHHICQQASKNTILAHLFSATRIAPRQPSDSEKRSSCCLSHTPTAHPISAREIARGTFFKTTLQPARRGPACDEMHASKLGWSIVLVPRTYRW